MRISTEARDTVIAELISGPAAIRDAPFASPQYWATSGTMVVSREELDVTARRDPGVAAPSTTPRHKAPRMQLHDTC